MLLGPLVPIHRVGLPLVLDNAHLLVRLWEPAQLNADLPFDSILLLLQQVEKRLGFLLVFQR